MSLLHIAVLLPLIFALIIPILYRFVKRIHLGWFVLPVPILLFIYFLSMRVNFIFKFLLISFWREKKHQFMVRKNH